LAVHGRDQPLVRDRLDVERDEPLHGQSLAASSDIAVIRSEIHAASPGERTAIHPFG
jgi:hypothetical protein